MSQTPAKRRAGSSARRIAPKGSQPGARALRLPGWGLGVVGFLASIGAGSALLFACGDKSGKEHERSSVPSSDEVSETEQNPAVAAAPAKGSASAESAAAESSAAAPDPEAPYTGPLLGAMAFQTPVYAEPRFGDDRIGYIRQGGKVPVDPTPIKKSNCKQGWYKLLDGGYVCGKYSSLDLEHPRIKLGVKQPDLSAILPYQYAYNRFHGTPLYKTLPTREDMLKYEPYLADKGKDKDKDTEPAKEKAGAKSVPDQSPGPGGEVPSPAASADPSAQPEERRKAKRAADDPELPKAEDALAAVTTFDAGPSEPEEEAPAKPWWQTDDKKPVVSLAELEQEADGNLSKRMVKGFFVAIDKSFGWNDRLWYRTTGGLVAPTDRMWINKPPEFKGIEWPKEAKSLYFMLSDKGQKYELSKDQKSMKANGKVARNAGFGLTDKTLEISKEEYVQALDGSWLRKKQGAITEVGKRPSDVGEKERWVDVDLSSRTLVLFDGDTPTYATLISPGKTSRNKKKDHRTPTGAWRIREKHIAVTMDGDGASGDLPYSIEDVPFVAYYKGSYALHGAFWHQNFGREMSHGCVNLAPKDARVVFDFVEPRMPRGWHAVWATKDRVGSMVVVHE